MSAPDMQTVHGAAQALRDKSVSARELAQSSLDRIASSKLNAFIDVRPDLTLAQADAADKLIASGQAGPLTGVPMAHKDIFVTTGWRSTAGSKMLKDYVSPYDAHVVSRFAAAGTVCLGKLNCDEFAMGSSNENSYFGAVKNPWDTRAIPGGSSGGSAAAVAAGLALFATGTDTGGSIRQPAAMCGVTGSKPSYGRVSRYGMIAFASSLDQGGPLARSAQDCALALSAMAGFDTRDATSVLPEALPAANALAADGREDFSRLLGKPLHASGSADRPLAGVRLGLPEEFFGAGLSADVRTAIDAALKQLESQGAELVSVSLPRTELSIPAYYVIAPAEASSNLSRFDGVRFGHRAEHYRDLKEMYQKSRSEGFGPEVQRRILVGSYVLSHGYYDAYYLKAQRVRRLIAQDWQAAFAKVDFIVGPITPTVAWNLGEKSDDPVQMYLTDIYTLSASLAGLPGMSIPVGFGAQGRPVGLQLVGNYYHEARLLALADWYQRATDWHQRQPAKEGV
jgi:aspartyl-tRNA(Asn)/glutamyl-tRNA(Gln) amidotransferase subunit A